MSVIFFFSVLLLILSVFNLVPAIRKRSYEWALISGMLLLLFAWFISLYPGYEWVIILPILHILLGIIFYFQRKASQYKNQK
jgi:uncharacterized membrane protein HdeD (DUF308 family)